MSTRRHQRPSRRTLLRAERADQLGMLRRLGCTCNPHLRRLPAGDLPSTVAPGSIGYCVEHEPGCVFGDAVARLNRAGIVPRFVDLGDELERRPWGH